MARFLYTVLLNPSLDEAKFDCRSGYEYQDSENVFKCQTIGKDSIRLSCVEACGAGIQINLIFNIDIDIDIANFEKSILILILILLGQYIARAIYC